VTLNLAGSGSRHYRVDGSLHWIIDQPSPRKPDSLFGLLDDIGAEVQWGTHDNFLRTVVREGTRDIETILHWNASALGQELSKAFPSGTTPALLSYLQQPDHDQGPLFASAFFQTATAANIGSILQAEEWYILSNVQQSLPATSILGWVDSLRSKGPTSYPHGGSGHNAKLVADYIESKGGKVILNSEVTRILVEGTDAAARVNGVRFRHRDMQSGMQQDMEVNASTVISNIFLPRTIELVGRSFWEPPFVEAAEKSSLAYATFSVYFGVKDNRVLERMRGSPTSLLLDSHDWAQNFARMNRGEVPFVDVTDYTQMDPGCCSPGTAAVSLFMPVNKSLWSPDEDVRAKQRARHAQKMLDRAEEYLPGLQAAIDASSVYIADPYDYTAWMGNPGGTYGGFQQGTSMDGQGERSGHSIANFWHVGQFASDVLHGGGQNQVAGDGVRAAARAALWLQG